MKGKTILLLLLGIVVIGAGIGAYMWNKPHRKVEDEKSISIKATELFRQYSAAEKAADSLYLDKTLEVSGVISGVDTNQSRQLVVILQTDDPIGGVACTLRDTNAMVKNGGNIVVKGICSGLVSDVKMTDCIVVQ